VRATVVEHTKLAPQDVFKFHRKKNYRRWNIHQQPVTVLRINAIEFSGKPSLEAIEAELRPVQSSAEKNAGRKLTSQ
jgi:hypothetical protein